MFDKSRIQIEKTEVMRYMGYQGQPLEDDLDERIDQLMKECLEVANPETLYNSYPLSQREDGIRIMGTSLVLRGNDIASHLKEADSCYIIGATLGSRMEQRLRQYEKTDMTAAIIFHSVGAAAIEAVCNQVEAEIKEMEAAQGRYITYRYSPGYGDFPIDFQRELIPALSMEKRLGITVTDSCIMMPRKSVTAIIGVCKTKQELAGPACASCNLSRECAMRKRGEYCGH